MQLVTPGGGGKRHVMTKPSGASATGPRVTGRAVRLPANLLFSPHHSELDLAVWAILDVLARAARDGSSSVPADPSIEWLATRWQVSTSGISKALARLSRAHKGRKDTEADAPVYVLTTVKGCGLNAHREVMAGAPAVYVPEASLGFGRPLVSTRAWRLYCAYLYLRHPRYATTALSHAQVAAVLHWKRETVVKYLAELQRAGLVVTRARTGRRTIVAPLLSIDAAGRADAERRANRGAAPVDNPVDEGGDAAPAAVGPSPCAGTSLPPLAGTEPTPPAGNAFLSPVPAYGDPDDESLAPARRLPLRGDARPGDEAAPPGRRWAPTRHDDPDEDPAGYIPGYGATTRPRGIHAPTSDPDNPGCCYCTLPLTSGNSLHSPAAAPWVTGWTNGVAA